MADHMTSKTEEVKAEKQEITRKSDVKSDTDDHHNKTEDKTDKKSAETKSDEADQCEKNTNKLVNDKKINTPSDDQGGCTDADQTDMIEPKVSKEEAECTSSEPVTENQECNDCNPVEHSDNKMSASEQKQDSSDATDTDKEPEIVTDQVEQVCYVECTDGPIKGTESKPCKEKDDGTMTQCTEGETCTLPKSNAQTSDESHEKTPDVDQDNIVCESDKTLGQGSESQENIYEAIEIGADVIGKESGKNPKEETTGDAHKVDTEVGEKNLDETSKDDLVSHPSMLATDSNTEQSSGNENETSENNTVLNEKTDCESQEKPECQPCEDQDDPECQPKGPSVVELIKLFSSYDNQPQPSRKSLKQKLSNIDENPKPIVCEQIEATETVMEESVNINAEVPQNCVEQCEVTNGETGQDRQINPIESSLPKLESCESHVECTEESVVGSSTSDDPKVLKTDSISQTVDDVTGEAQGTLNKATHVDDCTEPSMSPDEKNTEPVANSEDMIPEIHVYSPVEFTGRNDKQLKLESEFESSADDHLVTSHTDSDDSSCIQMNQEQDEQSNSTDCEIKPTYIEVLESENSNYDDANVSCEMQLIGEDEFVIVTMLDDLNAEPDIEKAISDSNHNITEPDDANYLESSTHQEDFVILNPVEPVDENTFVDLYSMIEKGDWQLVSKLSGLVGGMDLAVCPNGNVAITDFMASCVRIYSQSGQYLNTIHSGLERDKWYPYGITVGDNEHFYVTNRSPSVEVFDVHSRYKSQILSTETEPLQNTDIAFGGIAVDSIGHILVGDCTTNHINKLKQDGSLINSIKVNIKPRFISVCLDDTIAVSAWEHETGVQLIDADSGDVLHTLNAPLNVPYWCPSGVCCYKDVIFVSNCPRALDYPDGIYCFSVTTGECLRCITNDTFFPLGLATDGKKLLVTELKCIKVFQPV